VISEQQQNISYRFVSDFPFKNRAPHALDDFETNALSALRNHPNQQFTEVSASIFSDRVRLIGPVTMGPACVNCHNAHPESPKRDWKVGDVRGIQEINVSQAIATNIFSFKYLLAYFVFMAGSSVTFIGMQRRQAEIIRGMNRELETANDFLATLSMKIALPLAADIQEHIQRSKGRHDPHRAQEAHDLLFRHQGFYGNHGTPAAGTDDTVTQRVPYRDVQHRAQAWRHDRQIYW
jgi:adenylate cyclase